MTPAPFSKRFIAFVIDLFVLGFVMLLMQFTVPYLAPLLVWVFYKALFECSAVQATPGKRAMDLIVVGPNGERISMATSVLRTFVAWISLLTAFLIYLVALITPRQQTVHDLVANTFVIEGHLPEESGKAWLDEVKQSFEWIRGPFWDRIRGLFPSHSGISSEARKLELLEKLNTLRSQGAITEEEYQTRKQAILSR